VNFVRKNFYPGPGKHKVDEKKTPALTPIENLKTVMARLRHPVEGCPWDREQTFASVAPYTIEEAYEVSEAIDSKDMSSLKEELGDLLLQIVFHSRMAEESGDFNFDDVAQTISDKMICRHPHVFGKESERSKEFHSGEWEEQKRRERVEKAQRHGNTASVSVLDDVALALPALMRAEKLGKRVAKVGFEWPEIDSVFEKINEEIQELRSELEANEISEESIEEELGDILLTVATLARHVHVDPELALRRANAKFERRFRFIEESLAEDGQSPENVSLQKLEKLWQEAKQRKLTKGET